MRSFDAFARPVQEFQVKTAVGGYISIASLCLVLTLFCSELNYFLTPEAKDEMIVDQNQDRKYLNISFDISFSSMPCAALGLNLLDPKGVNVMHVDHEIYKTRLAKGQPMGRKIRDSLQNTATTPGQLHAAGLPEKGGPQNHSTRSLRCASCFQGHVDSDDCCNSCKELEATFRDTRPYVFAQCVDQLYQEELPRAAEGCRLEVRLEVRKVPGSIHIGVPRHVNLKHVVEEAKDVTIHADFTHAVRDLSFGPDFPGLIPVLNGRQKSNHQASSTEHYQYDFHVIPTSYQEDGGEPIPSHQYSVTEYVKAVDATEPTYEAAASGLWMNYDFTPFEVRVTNSRKSLFHFFTECCAILGGIFAFSGMLDNFAHQIQKSLANGSRSMLE